GSTVAAIRRDDRGLGGVLTLHLRARPRAVRAGHRYGADILEATGLGGGTVYKVLRRLERRGAVRGRWEDPLVAERERRPRRRYYRITPSGEAELASARERFGALARALGEGPPGPRASKRTGERRDPRPGPPDDALPEER
ncbi:MAG TPA: PadR family transcriptional regulator, partial [Longimicrobiales bacterium]|nr:PadR family transcriptional regulator [Longimicrobiales bacterium]